MSVSPISRNPADCGGPRPLVFEHIQADRRASALRRLLGSGSTWGREPVNRFLEYARSTGIRLDHLWSQVDADGKIVNTVLAVVNPGRTAMVFATQATDHTMAQTIGALIDHACLALSPAEVHVVQCLLELEERTQREAFVAGGFHELATLSYLQRPIRSSRGDCRSMEAEGVRLEPYTPKRRADVLRVLNQSYVDTADCPGLTGLRETPDILDGHRATGLFDASLWTLMYLDDKPMGVLLLNPSPAQDTVELVYIGLVSAARGKGLSRLLLRHGLSLLRDRKERTVTLAVDDCNAPALALYSGEGFQRIFRRRALIRSLQ